MTEAELLEQLVDAIAERAAALVVEQLRAEQPPPASGSRWLYTARDAAAYLGMPQGRVQKLTAARAIPHYRRDGEQRVSYRTDELDAWLDDAYEGPPRLRSIG